MYRQKSRLNEAMAERLINLSDNEEERVVRSNSQSAPDDVIPIFRARAIRPQSKYEGLDYDICENTLWEKEQMSKEPHVQIKKDFARWIVSLFIGILTALVGCAIAISIEEVSFYKYSWLQKGLYF